MGHFDDELKSHLAGAVARIAADPVGVDDVERRGRRRGRRRRFIAVVATVALVGAAAVGIRPLVAGDESTLDVAAGTPAVTPGPNSGAADQTPVVEDESASGATTTAVPTTFRSVPSVGLRYEGGGADGVVPWGDGFLLIEQGLSQLLVQQSTDGSTWTDVVGFDPPVPVESIRRIVSDGTHLVIQSQIWEPVTTVDGDGGAIGPGPSKLSVLVTTDLSNWQTYDITSPTPDAPPYVRREQWTSALAIGPDGWLASVQSSSYVDLLTLLPAEVRETEGGVDYRQTSDGIQVVISPQTEDPRLSLTDGEAVGAATTTTRLYTWDELGLNPTEAADLRSTISEVGNETITWVGPWEGVVRSSSSGSGFGYVNDQVVGTDAGFLVVRYNTETGRRTIEFSPDGLTWSAADPLPVDWFGSVIAVEGGVLINTNGPYGTVMWRGNPDGTDWSEVDVPGLSDGPSRLYGQPIPGPGYVAIVDVSEADYTPQPPVEFDVGIEQEGQSIHLYAHDDGTADVIITDLATGDIVAEINGAFSGLNAEFVKIGDDSITIIDDDGKEVASIPLQVIMETVLPARDEAILASDWQPPPPPSPDLMVVASADGLQWLVAPYEAQSPSAMAINGTTVVVRMGSAWQTFRIA